jgi:hypothetical protein
MPLAIFLVLQGFWPVAAPAAAAPEAPAVIQPAPSAAQATYVPVCRDARGAWDRRACRHRAPNDPRRLTLA